MADRQRRAELHRSLNHPHPDTADLADQGFAEWARELPDEDAGELVDTTAGKPIRWVPGEGWAEP